MKKFDEQQTFENLLDFKHTLDKYSIQFFVEGGALLGWIREGGLIDHDKGEVDVLVWSSDFPALRTIDQDLINSGFRILPNISSM